MNPLCWKNLDQKRRDAFVIRGVEVDKKTYRELADETGINISTVAYHYTNASGRKKEPKRESTNAAFFAKCRTILDKRVSGGKLK